MSMRSWLPASCAVLALVLGGGAVLWNSHKPASKAFSATDNKEIEELQAHVARLQARMSNNEQTVGTLAWANKANAAGAVPSAAASEESAAGESSPGESAEPPRPPRPTRAQQTARFERHFAELDAMRGTAPDVDMERKMRTLLTDSSAQKLTVLTKATVDRVSCGNQLCRVDMSFKDAGSVRLGQTEMQIQLASLNHGATIYADDDTGQLHAYFNTGNAEFPAFPSLADVTPSDKGG
jgi:hypothetical protein